MQSNTSILTNTECFRLSCFVQSNLCIGLSNRVWASFPLVNRAAKMLVPTVSAASASAPADVRRLSIIGFVNASLTTEVLAALAPADADSELKRAVLDSRALVGPFLPDMMAAAASWLDQGARKVVVDAASAEEMALEAAAIAVSELPASRVVLRVPVSSTADASALESKLLRLKASVGGVIVSVAGEEEAPESALAILQPLRKALGDARFMLAVEWPSAPSVAVIAALHHKDIGVVANGAEADAALAFVRCLRSDRPDGLFATVVADAAGVALGLVYSSEESVLAAIASGRGVYYSRSRGGLWRKGETSGNAQTLLQLDVDCDSDALRFTVEQTGAGFCHLDTRSCWGEATGLRALQQVLEDRLANAPEGSYTQRLFRDPALLRNKLVEEAQELAEAESKPDVAGEAADVLYFALVRCVAAGVSIDDAEVSRVSCRLYTMAGRG